MWFSPPLVFSVVLVSIYATLFHLWRGKTLKDLLLYWLAALLGFGLGQIIGNSLGFDVLMIGQVHVVEATLISWLFLEVARWLKVPRRSEEQSAKQ